MLILATVSLINIEKIAIFLLVLSILVVLHEYGHFLVARLNKVRVLEFAVGMGPLLFGWRSKKSGTLYSLRALPIGGYCAMHGEDNKISEAEGQREFRQTVIVNGKEYDTDNFQAKSAWQRLAIVVAGPLANFILTLVILFVSAAVFGTQTDQIAPVVGPLTSGMPAKVAGLHAGDRIVSINGVRIRNGSQLIDTIHQSLRKPLDIRYSRNGSVSQIEITPVRCPAPEEKLGCIGFSPIPTYSRVSLSAALTSSFRDFAFIGQQTFGSLALLASQPMKYGKHISGVVGMGQAAMTVQDLGWAPYLFFAALISFALGVFNLLPLPALDGGRGAFIIGELLRGKPVDPEKEAWVHVTGFAVLIALMLVINFYNVVQIVQGKGPF